MRILVTGSRDWPSLDRVSAALSEAARGIPAAGVTVVQGAAPGADTLAAQAALRLGMRVEAYPAHWKLLGKQAGHIRNQVMVDSGADLCLAFVMPCRKTNCPNYWPHDSHGTADCMARARAAGIPVRRYDL